MISFQKKHIKTTKYQTFSNCPHLCLTPDGTPANKKAGSSSPSMRDGGQIGSSVRVNE